MLFHKAVAAISILAVGGANASLEWTAVGSNVPRNKPDGRVIFGKTLQRRSLCNHDDCDEPELTTIIIGGGGTLPPKPVSNVDSNHAPSPVHPTHSTSTVDAPTHSTVDAPSPTMNEHHPTTSTSVGNEPSFAPTVAIIFDGQTNEALQTVTPVPGSNTSPPSSPSSNMLNPIPPIPTAQITYQPTSDLIFEGETPTYIPQTGINSNPPSSLVTNNLMAPTLSPTEGLIFEGQIPTFEPVPGTKLPTYLIPGSPIPSPASSQTSTPPFPLGSSNTHYPTKLLGNSPAPTNPETKVAPGVSDGPPIIPPTTFPSYIPAPINPSLNPKMTASPTDGDVPSVASTTEKPFGTIESTDSSWVSPTVVADGNNGSVSSPAVYSSKSGKEGSTVYTDSAWASPPTASISDGSDSSTAVYSSKSDKEISGVPSEDAPVTGSESSPASSSKSGKEVGSVSWLESSSAAYSSKSEKDASPTSSIESSPAADIDDGSDWPPLVYSSKSEKVDSIPAAYSSKSDKDVTSSGTSDWPSTGGYSSKSEKIEPMPVANIGDAPTTYDSKAEKVESSSAEWSAPAMYSSKSDKEENLVSPVESSPSSNLAPATYSSKSDKDESISSAVYSSKSDKNESIPSAVYSSKSDKDESIPSAVYSSKSEKDESIPSIVNSSKPNKDESIVSTDSSWASPPSAAVNGNESDMAPVINSSSKSGKEGSDLESSPVASIGEGSDWSSPTGYTTANGSKSMKSGKTFFNGIMGPEMIKPDSPTGSEGVGTGTSFEPEEMLNPDRPTGSEGVGTGTSLEPEEMLNPDRPTGSEGVGTGTSFEPDEMLNPDRPTGSEGVGTGTSFEPEEMLNPDRPTGSEGVGTGTSFEPEEMLYPDRPTGSEGVGTGTSFEPDEMLYPDRPTGSEGVGTGTSFEPEEMLNPDRPTGSEGVGTGTSFEPEEMLNPDRPTGDDGSGGDSIQLEDDFAEGIMNEAISIPVLLNDTLPCEAEGVFGTPEHGTIIESTEDGFIYVPDTDFCGYDKFDYEISSGDYFDSATVTVHILCDTKAVIEGPSAVNDAVTITQNSGMVIYNVLDNDNGGEGCDGLVVESILYDATHGSCKVRDGAVVTYEPNDGYHGQDNCVYNACNQFDMCDSAVLSITVTPASTEDIPEESADVVSTEEQRTSLSCTTTMNEPVVVEALSTDIEITSHGDYGTCSVTNESLIMYTPEPGFAGYDVCGFSSCDSTGSCIPDALAIIVTPDALPIERMTTVESSVSILLEEYFNLEHTEVVISYNPTYGTLEAGAEEALIYTPNPGFKGTEMLEYSLRTLVEPVLCDKSTITFVVGAADAMPATDQSANDANDSVEGEETKEIIVTSENSAQEKASTSMISIGAAVGALLVLGAAAAYRKRSHSATDVEFKGVPTDVITSISTPPDSKSHPHGSSLEHAYADCNNISVTSFLTGETTSPYGPTSKRSFLKKSKIPSSSNSLFSSASVKSKKSAVVEDVVDL